MLYFQFVSEFSHNRKPENLSSGQRLEAATQIFPLLASKDSDTSKIFLNEFDNTWFCFEKYKQFRELQKSKVCIQKAKYDIGKPRRLVQNIQKKK